MRPSAAELFGQLMRTAPFQPATNLWRAVELDAVLRHGLPAGRGLDLGCGDGKLSAIVDAALTDANQARRWTGVDIDPLETAQAESIGLYERVHTVSADAIPEADASFDFVFSNSVLEHVPPIESTLAEAARLLRPGGRFVLTVPGPGFHKALRGPARNGDRDAYLRGVDERCAHLRYWDLETWTERLRACGLEVRLHQSYLSVQQTRRWERLSAWTGGLMHRLYGGRSRPIEIQRRLGMRNARPGLLGRLAAALAPLFAMGCPLEAQALQPNEEGACLLIEAVKLETPRAAQYA